MGNQELKHFLESQLRCVEYCALNSDNNDVRQLLSIILDEPDTWNFLQKAENYKQKLILRIKQIEVDNE